MTRLPQPPFVIKVDGVLHSYRYERDAAIIAARSLQQQEPGSKITVTDTRDGSAVPFSSQGAP